MSWRSEICASAWEILDAYASAVTLREEALQAVCAAEDDDEAQG